MAGERLGPPGVCVDLEHIIRAASTIADDDEIVVVGTTRSRATVIDGSIGEAAGDWLVPRGA